MDVQTRAERVRGSYHAAREREMRRVMGMCLVCGQQRGQGSLLCGPCGRNFARIAAWRPRIADDLDQMFLARVARLRQLAH